MRLERSYVLKRHIPAVMLAACDRASWSMAQLVPAWNTSTLPQSLSWEIIIIIIGDNNDNNQAELHESICIALLFYVCLIVFWGGEGKGFRCM